MATKASSTVLNWFSHGPLLPAPIEQPHQIQAPIPSVPCHLCGDKDFRLDDFDNDSNKTGLSNLKVDARQELESVLKCNLCPYSTKHYSNMYVHIRTHTGDKPYWCGDCGAAFTQGSSLKLHIRSRHHGNMAYFSLNRKLGKSRLTRLWHRVTRRDANNPTLTNSVKAEPQIPDPGCCGVQLCDRATMTEASSSTIETLIEENRRLRQELRAVQQTATRLQLTMAAAAAARFGGFPGNNRDGICQLLGVSPLLQSPEML